ncbi:Hypothetical_protein [Hexamita inflata]|uniref:Hypothetical_protein n=1 Tax=Hexamita inflata TaxID=28002 RepID=A0AA86RGI5_9EUKA|nr:Hypothetical protein HINF_LOCUS65719 [Hexamita inflata]
MACQKDTCGLGAYRGHQLQLLKRTRLAESAKLNQKKQEKQEERNKNQAGSVKLAGSNNYCYIIILTYSQQIWYRGQGYVLKVTGSIPALNKYYYNIFTYYTYLPNRLSILTSQF